MSTLDFRFTYVVVSGVLLFTYVFYFRGFIPGDRAFDPRSMPTARAAGWRQGTSRRGVSEPPVIEECRSWRMGSCRAPQPRPLRSSGRITRPSGLRGPTGKRGQRRRSGRSWNRTAVASLLAAPAAAAGAVFTGLSLQATRAQNTVAEQGRFTDRFTKAVDQLDRSGPEHLQARSGAVYALDRLARDSSRDHPTTVEILSASIRTTGGRPTPTGGKFVRAGLCPGRSVAPDVQATLTVLGRRDTTREDLDNATLTDTDLLGAHLTCASLDNANLSNADLTQADLTDAKLTGADLTGADLTDARHDDNTIATGVLVDERTKGRVVALIFSGNTGDPSARPRYLRRPAAELRKVRPSHVVIPYGRRTVTLRGGGSGHAG